MRHSSHSASPSRRVPQQARAEERIASFLAAAAEVIAEKGYAAATLTEVASRAGTSIGSLYQYFPDKPAVVAALAGQYGREIDELWARLAADTGGRSLTETIDRMLKAIEGYLRERPAFPALLAGADGYRHEADVRTRLRVNVAAVLQPYGDRSASVTDRIAETTVQIIKAFCAAIGEVASIDRPSVSKEYRCALTAYLQARLQPSPYVLP